MSLLTLAPLRAGAEGANAPVGTAPSGLRGLVHTGMPVAQEELNLAGSAGYGMTESIGGVPGAHHRAQGGLGVALAPLPWLSLALRVDGRLELHPDDGEGSHSAGFGDPRLFVRAGHAANDALSFGGELVLWFPGQDAPSIEPGATSVDLKGLIAHAPKDGSWALLGALGLRLDNSAKSAPDLNRLRLGDRIALGISDAHAVLVALGVARRLGDAGELFGELSADVLFGGDAPPFMQSPLRVALGARYHASRALQLELTSLVSLSSRPEVTPADPLVPIEPRLMLLASVRYGLRFGEPEETFTPPDEPAVAAPKPAAKPAEPEPQFTSVTGQLVDDSGAPLPEAKVLLRAADGEERETISDAEGGYFFGDVPLGAATLEVRATGFEVASWELDVQPEMERKAQLMLTPKTDVGVLRGLIRSFGSEPLRAQVEVRDARRKQVASVETDEKGNFELELPPGRYHVTIRATGYRPHSRSMKLSGNSVEILNVDMREEK